MIPIGTIHEATDESAPRPFRVLVVAAAARHARVRALLMPLPDIGLRLHDAPIDALLAVIRCPFHLVLLDQTLDHASAPALTQHLVRVAPQVGVLHFDDEGAESADALAATYRWDQAPTLVTAWVDARRINAVR